MCEICVECIIVASYIVVAVVICYSRCLMYGGQNGQCTIANGERQCTCCCYMFNMHHSSLVFGRRPVFVSRNPIVWIQCVLVCSVAYGEDRSGEPECSQKLVPHAFSVDEFA